jgi:UDP-glucuronate decarboxylase
MLQLAETVKKLTGSKSKIEFRPLPQDDPKQRRPDISKARKILGWEPSINLETGLLKTIIDFENRLVKTRSVM